MGEIKIELFISSVRVLREFPLARPSSIKKGKSIMLQMRIDVLPIDLFTRLAINIYTI